MPFSSRTKMTAVVIVVQNSQSRGLDLLVKGAPEYILTRCANIIAADGSDSGANDTSCY